MSGSKGDVVVLGFSTFEMFLRICFFVVAVLVEYVGQCLDFSVFVVIVCEFE